MSGPGASASRVEAAMKRAMSGMGIKKPRRSSGALVRASRGGAKKLAREPLLLRRFDRNGRLALRTLLRVLHVAGGRREERVVLADADVDAGVKHRAALADEDRARVHELATEGLQAQALALGIAAV